MWNFENFTEIFNHDEVHHYRLIAKRYKVSYDVAREESQAPRHDNVSKKNVAPEEVTTASLGQEPRAKFSLGNALRPPKPRDMPIH